MNQWAFLMHVTLIFLKLIKAKCDETYAGAFNKSGADTKRIPGQL